MDDVGTSHTVQAAVPHSVSLRYTGIGSGPFLRIANGPWEETSQGSFLFSLSSSR